MTAKATGALSRENGAGATDKIRHCEPQQGAVGAVSAAHPLATEAALFILEQGGGAVDAVISAQAVISVAMPQAAGLGGDMLALVHHDGEVTGFNGVGRSPAIVPQLWGSDGGSSVTVPGIVPAWESLHKRFGRLLFSQVLEPAITLATEGYRIDESLAAALEAQRPRLLHYGGDQWGLLKQRVGDTWYQPELARFLTQLATDGTAGYYLTEAAALMAKAASCHGGVLSVEDFRDHQTTVAPPIHTSLGEQTLWVQPPSSQGVLLAMAAKWLHDNPRAAATNTQHVLAELTDAVFTYRDQCARGTENFNHKLEVNLDKASKRGGARAYLHTAGVAVADSDGMVVSSLISVFDDFGSGVFVPELGIVLNNRAAGFTAGDNSPRLNAYPVHTLAPAMLTGPGDEVLALATPGADGQIQTLLQVISRLLLEQNDLAHALAAPRWRGQDQKLLIEDDHPEISALEQKGHDLRVLPPGDDLFGAVVAAGYAEGKAFAASDWRRKVITGSVS